MDDGFGKGLIIIFGMFMALCMVGMICDTVEQIETAKHHAEP